MEPARHEIEALSAQASAALPALQAYLDAEVSPTVLAELIRRSGAA